MRKKVKILIFDQFFDFECLILLDIADSDMLDDSFYFQIKETSI